MKKVNVSIILNLIFFLFLFATFFLQYEFLFVTRVVLIFFTTVFLVIEIKQEYLLLNKMMFIIFSVISMIALIVSVLLDNASENLLTNEKNLFIPVYAFILIVILYKDLYDKDKT